MSRTTQKSRTYGAPAEESRSPPTGCVPTALGVKYPAGSGTSPNTALHAFLPGRDKEGLGELTADHVDVRRQATVDLGRGQAHLGGQRRSQGQKLTLSKSCYHSHMYYGLNGVPSAQTHMLKS